jgi:hypothetical protein
VSAETKSLESDLAQRAADARSAVRNVERFAYRIVSDALKPSEVAEAASILRLAVGLRRKLDLWGRSKSV